MAKKVVRLLLFWCLGGFWDGLCFAFPPPPLTRSQVVLHMPTGPGAGEGNCTRIPSSVLGQAMAELRSLMLPDHKGDGTATF